MKPKFNKMKTFKSGLWLKRENQIHSYLWSTGSNTDEGETKKDGPATGSKTEPWGTPQKFVILPVNGNKKMRTLKQDADVRLCKLRVLF